MVASSHTRPRTASGGTPDPDGHDQGHPRWFPGCRLRTVELMNPSAPTAEPGDAQESEASTHATSSSTPTAVDDDRILGGVAGFLAGRLGVDPLWVRIGFVLLALAGGIGIVLYAGLWLVLTTDRSTSWRWPRCRRWGDRRHRDPAVAQRRGRAVRDGTGSRRAAPDRTRPRVVATAAGDPRREHLGHRDR